MYGGYWPYSQGGWRGYREVHGALHPSQDEGIATNYALAPGQKIQWVYGWWWYQGFHMWPVRYYKGWGDRHRAFEQFGVTGWRWLGPDWTDN